MAAAVVPQPHRIYRQVGRLEPFVAASVLIHALLLLLMVPRWAATRPVVSLAQGAVVQVVLVPEPASQREQAGSRRPTSARPGRRDGPGALHARQPEGTEPPAQAAASRGEQRLTSPASPMSAAAAQTQTAAAPAADPSRRQPQESAGPAPAPQGQARSEAAQRAVAVSEVLPRLGLPVPVYPKNAVSQGLEGQVSLLLTVNADGRVQHAVLQKGSGHRQLDEAAMAYARAMALAPLGRPYQVSMRFRYRLERDSQGRVLPRVDPPRLLGTVRFLEAVSGPGSAEG